VDSDARVLTLSSEPTDAWNANANANGNQLHQQIKIEKLMELPLML
jgi:hypothetical protein